MHDFCMERLFSTMSSTFTVLERKALQTTVLTIIPAAKPKHPVLTACLFILCHDDEIGNSLRVFPRGIPLTNYKKEPKNIEF